MILFFASFPSAYALQCCITSADIFSFSHLLEKIHPRRDRRRYNQQELFIITSVVHLPKIFFTGPEISSCRQPYQFVLKILLNVFFDRATASNNLLAILLLLLPVPTFTWSRPKQFGWPTDRPTDGPCYNETSEPDLGMRGQASKQLQIRIGKKWKEMKFTSCD